jgi:hypothetical protein
LTTIPALIERVDFSTQRKNVGKAQVVARAIEDRKRRWVRSDDRKRRLVGSDERSCLFLYFKNAFEKN